MPHTAIVVLIIFILTVVMIMSGRGGGNFYVIALVLSGVPIHTASTTSQFILLASALAGALIFGKAKTISGIITIVAAVFMMANALSG